MYRLVIMDILLSSYYSKPKLLQFTISLIIRNKFIFIRIDRNKCRILTKYKVCIRRRKLRGKHLISDEFRNNMFLLWNKSGDIGCFCGEIKWEYKVERNNIIIMLIIVIITYFIPSWLIFNNKSTFTIHLPS